MPKALVIKEPPGHVNCIPSLWMVLNIHKDDDVGTITTNKDVGPWPQLGRGRWVEVLAQVGYDK